MVVAYFSFLLQIIGKIWFLLAPILAWELFRGRWLTIRQIDYAIANKGTILLEVIPPRDLEKTAESMDHILTSLHSIKNMGLWFERYLGGFSPSEYWFELVANNGHIQFFVRCPKALKDFVVSRIYSQYPEAEVNEVEDYLKKFPGRMPNKDWDLYGVEFKLKRGEDTKTADAYKLKTYPEVEATAAMIQEPKRHDSISFLAEAATDLSRDEWIVFHILAVPVPSDKDVPPELLTSWMARAKKARATLIGEKEEEKKKSLTEELPGIVSGAVSEAITSSLGGGKKKAEEKEEKKEDRAKLRLLTDVEKHTLEDIEGKMSKPIFISGVRAAYIARKDLFEKNKDSRVAVLYGSLNIFDDPSGVEFTENDETATYASDPFEDRKEFVKKYIMWGNLKGRSAPPSFVTYALCTEEIASLFHLPTIYVGPAGVKRVESRKGPAEINIPIIEELP